MNTSEFDYDLPPEFIAQTPVEPRDHSRLLVYERTSEVVSHEHFYNLPQFLIEGDVLVLNRTRVIKARLKGRKMPGGGRVEVLLLNQTETRTWEAMVGGSGLTPGRKITFEFGPGLEIIADRGGSLRLVEFETPVDEYLEEMGMVPLPPYIHEPLQDAQRYQTVYAQVPGSAAAPTAGLHFTKNLLAEIAAKGVHICSVILHVGLDTFSPVSEAEAEKHVIHSEWFQVSNETAEVVNQAKSAGRRIIAAGTTSVRALESSTINSSRTQIIEGKSGSTNLYILPGYGFKVVDAMITNFHLPRSTLIMMVSAFTGKDKLFSLYEKAKMCGYRFYSFGDAMLIL